MPKFEVNDMGERSELLNVAARQLEQDLGPGEEAENGSPREAPQVPEPGDDPPGTEPSEVEATAEAAVEVEESPPARDSSPSALSYGDHHWDDDEAKELVEVWDWTQSLSDHDRQQIVALFSGEYRLTPMDSPEASRPTEDTRDSKPETYTVDPTAMPEDAAKYMQGMQDEMAELRKRLDEVDQARERTEQEEFEAGIESASTAFSETHGLSGEQMYDLRERVIQLGTIPSLMGQGKTAEEAMNESLELAMWSTPDLRDQQMDSRVQERMADLEVEERTARASSVASSGGGNTPRVDPTPKDPRQAMIDEIASHMADS